MSGASEQLLSIIFGWVLGIGSHFIIDALKRRRDDREMRAALKVELSEHQYRMVAVVFGIDSRLGTVDRAKLEWMRPIVVGYKGVHASDKLLANIDGLLKLTDQELALLGVATKAKDDIAMSLQKYAIPLFDSKLALLGSFEHEPELQSTLLEVRANVSMYNDLVDLARYYLNLTFTNTSKTNEPRIVANLTSTYNNASSRARIIADQIDKIKW